MPMSLFKNNKNRNKVVNPYCSLGWLLIITIFQKCAKLKASWVHLGKQNNTIIFFFLLFIFLTKKWTSAVCEAVRAHPSHPPPLPLPTGLLSVYCLSGPATSYSFSQLAELACVAAVSFPFLSQAESEQASEKAGERLG